MGIRFSESTIKAGFLVQNPDWYNYKCTKVLEKPAAGGASKNYIMVWEGLHTPDTSDEMVGVPVSILINEKADWVWLPLYVAANGGKQPEPGTELEPKQLLDITLCARTVRGVRQDQTPCNNLVEWRPVRA